VKGEGAKTMELYGCQPGDGSFASNCLLARRLAERGVRFIQLYHRGWDQHYNLPSDLRLQCGDIDQPCAALVRDLKQRGLLDDTLVIWGGEFGRTSMQENRGGKKMALTGRDHNPLAFTLWMAGGGVKPGHTHGSTDDLGYEAVVDKVSPHDFHATLLHLLGYDHTRFTYPVAGVNMRLSNVTKPGSKVVKEIIA
jgi:uncharacterized protein (DUF1501 family)